MNKWTFVVAISVIGVGASVAIENSSASAETNSSASAATKAPVATTATNSGQIGSVKLNFEHAMQTRAAVTVNHGAPGKMALTTDEAKSALLTGQTSLSKVFTSGQLKNEQANLANAVAAEKSGNTVVQGAGISKFTFKKVSIAGSTATVVADVTAWSSFKIRQTPGSQWITASPANVLITKATLTKDSSGKWVVSKLLWNFAPGSTP